MSPKPNQGEKRLTTPNNVRWSKGETKRVTKHGPKEGNPIPPYRRTKGILVVLK